MNVAIADFSHRATSDRQLTDQRRSQIGDCSSGQQAQQVLAQAALPTDATFIDRPTKRPDRSTRLWTRVGRETLNQRRHTRVNRLW